MRQPASPAIAEPEFGPDARDLRDRLLARARRRRVVPTARTDVEAEIAAFGAEGNAPGHSAPPPTFSP